MNAAQLAVTGELAATLVDAHGPSKAALAALPVGLHDGIPEHVYHARIVGFAGKGALDRIARAPAAYKAWVDGLVVVETPALRFGKALHTAVLEPARFRSTYVVEPDFGDCRKTDNRSRRDTWRAEHAGAVVLTDKESAQLSGMLESVLAHPTARPLLESARIEVTARWDDPDTGLPVKARPDDYVEDLGIVLDIKSTQDASPDGFRRSVANYRYGVQDSLYTFGLERVGHPVSRFIFLAVEKEPPYLVGLYDLDSESRHRSLEAWRRNMDTLANCTRTGVWPGLPNTIQTLSLPPWAA